MDVLDSRAAQAGGYHVGQGSVNVSTASRIITSAANGRIGALVDAVLGLDVLAELVDVQVGAQARSDVEALAIDLACDVSLHADLPLTIS